MSTLAAELSAVWNLSEFRQLRRLIGEGVRSAIAEGLLGARRVWAIGDSGRLYYVTAGRVQRYTLPLIPCLVIEVNNARHETGPAMGHVTREGDRREARGSAPGESPAVDAPDVVA